MITATAAVTKYFSLSLHRVASLALGLQCSLFRSLKMGRHESRQSLISFPHFSRKWEKYFLSGCQWLADLCKIIASFGLSKTSGGLQAKKNQQGMWSRCFGPCAVGCWNSLRAWLVLGLDYLCNKVFFCYIQLEDLIWIYACCPPWTEAKCYVPSQ